MIWGCIVIFSVGIYNIKMLDIGTNRLMLLPRLGDNKGQPQPFEAAVVNISQQMMDGQTSFVDARPFNALQGHNFHIFRPMYEAEIRMTLQNEDVRLLAPPEVWVNTLLSQIEWLDILTAGNGDRSPLERARNAYFENLKHHALGMAYGDEEREIAGVRIPFRLNLLTTQQQLGERSHQTYLGYTMLSAANLDMIKELVIDVMQKHIPGDYIETGVWRGGASIFARGVLRAYNEGNRRSFVCDSFRGIPPGRKIPSLKKYRVSDIGWDNNPYLQIPADKVARHFRMLGMLDPNVIFAEGLFAHTMKPLRPVIDALAVIRLDGDLYDSTMDVLYHLYDRLSIGGYVIVDDWEFRSKKGGRGGLLSFPARVACLEFFQAHGMTPRITKTQGNHTFYSAYWQKTEHIEVQYWRYVSRTFVGPRSSGDH